MEGGGGGAEWGGVERGGKIIDTNTEDEYNYELLPQLHTTNG